MSKVTFAMLCTALAVTLATALNLTASETAGCADPARAAMFLEELQPMFSDSTPENAAFRQRLNIGVVPPGQMEVVSDSLTCTRVAGRVEQIYSQAPNWADLSRSGYTTYVLRFGSIYAAPVDFSPDPAMEMSARTPVLLFTADSLAYLVAVAL